jgi:uncharacterized protein YjbI with pentapeptide repeats
MRIFVFALLVPLANGFTPLFRNTVLDNNIKAADVTVKTILQERQNNDKELPWWKKSVASSLLGFSLIMSSASAVCPPPAFAASDYAKVDITGQDFSNGNYEGIDFTGAIAKGTNFQKSNLQKCRFSKANLDNADFTGADVRGVSFEDSSMDGTSLKNANAQGAYFSPSILDAGDLENVDMTNSVWPSKLLVMICDRTDLKGTNPDTGVVARDSILCPE